MFCNFSRFLILLAYFIFYDNLLMLYVLSVAISIVTQLFIPAEGPSIPQLLSREYLLPANSLFTVSFYLTTILGSIAAGPSLGLLGSQPIYLILSAFMLLAYLFTSRLPQLAAEKQLSAPFNLISLARPILEGLIFIYRHKRIKQSLYLLTFSQALIATLAVLAPGFAHKILMTDITASSLLVLGPSALGLVSGAMLVGVCGRRFLRGSLILTGIVATGVSLILLSLFSSGANGVVLYFILFLLFIIGISNSLINVPSSTILQEETETRVRGRIYGVLTSLTGGFSILPVLFSGLLADIVGIANTLITIGIFVLGIGIFYVIQRHKIIALNG